MIYNNNWKNLILSEWQLKEEEGSRYFLKPGYFKVQRKNVCGCLFMFYTVITGEYFPYTSRYDPELRTDCFWQDSE